MLYKNPLETEWLTTQDVTAVPNLSFIRNRSDVILSPYIYSAPMDTVTGKKLTKAMVDIGEFAVISRFLPDQEWEETVSLYAGHENVFIAVGLDCESILDKLVDISSRYSWPDDIQINLALDIAHGDMSRAHALTKYLRGLKFVRHIMSGSICTADAAFRAIDNGCTHLRVGVGPGAACTTRIKTGIGLPNLTAVYKIAKRIRAFEHLKHIQIIADGGIKEPGDANKYLFAGADGVMLGNILSRTFESAGWKEMKDGGYGIGMATYFKQFRGQASASFQTEVLNKTSSCPEGATSDVFFRNPNHDVKRVVEEFRAGLSSACSYLGVESTDQLGPHTVELVKITPSGWTEGTSHGV